MQNRWNVKIPTGVDRILRDANVTFSLFVRLRRQRVNVSTLFLFFFFSFIFKMCRPLCDLIRDSGKTYYGVQTLS